MFAIRKATNNDFDTLHKIDLIAQKGHQRHTFIERAVGARNCVVLEATQNVVGYAVLEYSFYDNGFVSMIYILPEYRRKGAGAMLMKHLESTCETPKLFTSTNLSNLPMQSLLARLDYKLSGTIYNLDEGDPELVYFKLLK
jgi:N-acetylglutamate synthase-like GNAT family acetyltransferase